MYKLKSVLILLIIYSIFNLKINSMHYSHPLCFDILRLVSRRANTGARLRKQGRLDSHGLGVGVVAEHGPEALRRRPSSRRRVRAALQKQFRDEHHRTGRVRQRFPALPREAPGRARREYKNELMAIFSCSLFIFITFF